MNNHWVRRNIRTGKFASPRLVDEVGLPTIVKEVALTHAKKHLSRDAAEVGCYDGYEAVPLRDAQH